MRIIKETTACLIIDIQERLLPTMHEKEALVKNTQILIEGLKALGIPFLCTQQYTKGLGETVNEISTLIDDTGVIEKKSFSCCDEPSFISALEKVNKKHVIIAGIESHVCVLQTCIDLIQRNFHPIIVKDCISSRKSTDSETAIERMRLEGAIITSYESILFELCRYAGNESFKKISKLVK